MLHFTKGWITPYNRSLIICTYFSGEGITMSLISQKEINWEFRENSPPDIKGGCFPFISPVSHKHLKGQFTFEKPMINIHKWGFNLN